MSTPNSGAQSKAGQKATGKTLAQSYIALPARTRLYFSLGVCAVAATGLFVSDYLEKSYPQTSSNTTKS
ncbi:hypothetical protein BDN72DRAFT_891169 [Pluteus cervinus]|uniref:Uncharacterized protein n=1 Tax=Pluteus cervinus TaxID=181527 RepID=A0ACD3BIA9_9AGAR|nr:hypothetical protein BDN72DRAFT_891169 [Pluteus cervinus]